MARYKVLLRETLSVEYEGLVEARSQVEALRLAEAGEFEMAPATLYEEEGDSRGVALREAGSEAPGELRAMAAEREEEE